MLFLKGGGQRSKQKKDILKQICAQGISVFVYIWRYAESYKDTGLHTNPGLLLVLHEVALYRDINIILIAPSPPAPAVLISMHISTTPL